MKHIFLLVTVLTAFGFGFVPVASAQDTGAIPTTTDTASSTNSTATQPIDSDTALVDSRINGDGDAVLILESDETQTVTFTDAGAFLAGNGQIPQSTRTVQEGRNKIVISNVTIHKGGAAIGINTGEVLYGVKIRTSTNLIGGPYTAQDAQNAAVSGALSVALVSVVIVIRYLRGTSNSPEKIA